MLEQTLAGDADIKILPPPTDAETKILTPPVEEEIPIQTPLAMVQLAGEEDNMLYPYPKYNDKMDTEAHVRAFFDDMASEPCVPGTSTSCCGCIKDSRIRVVLGKASSELIFLA